MAQVFDGIDAKLAAWIGRQRLFFVGTAPSGLDGHVNVSPKGTMDCLRILGPREVAYLDFVGSGAETIAHIRENGRIVLMFCDFEGPPRIIRLHGRGSAVQLGDPEFEGLVEQLGFGGLTAGGTARSIVRIEVERIADSCGYGVPLMEYVGERTQAKAWADNRRRTYGPDALVAYMAENNEASIDGLPGLEVERLPLSRS